MGRPGQRRRREAAEPPRSRLRREIRGDERCSLMAGYSSRSGWQDVGLPAGSRRTRPRQRSPAGPGPALPFAAGMLASDDAAQAAVSTSPPRQDEEGKYPSHDRKIYAPAGFNSVAAAVGPMSCPLSHNGARLVLVAEERPRRAGRPDRGGTARRRPGRSGRQCNNQTARPGQATDQSPIWACHPQRRSPSQKMSLAPPPRGRERDPGGYSPRSTLATSVSAYSSSMPFEAEGAGTASPR